MSDVDITKYSIVRAHGLWLIGIVVRQSLHSALEISHSSQLNGNQMTVQLQAHPLLMMADIDELPIPGAPSWPVADMSKSRQGQLREVVNIAEGIRESMQEIRCGSALLYADATVLPKLSQLNDYRRK